MSSSNGLLPEGAALTTGYEVIEHLSRGMALDVYDAWSKERDCRCIVKVVRPDRREARVRARLVTEGELLLGLSHPHIVRAYELVRRPRTVLVLETLDGETLEHLIETATRRLAAEDLVELGLQLASAIGYLHRRGHLHLDLKPSNVVVEGGQVKVIDLSLGGSPGRSKRGAGSPPYLAPEQARGEIVDRSTDVWGIGATLYEAATGLLPFPDARPGHYPQGSRPAARVSESRRLPPHLRSVIDACLSGNKQARPEIPELVSGLDPEIP